MEKNKETIQYLHRFAGFPEIRFILENIFCDTIIYNKDNYFLNMNSLTYDCRELLKKTICDLGWDNESGHSELNKFIYTYLVSGVSNILVKYTYNKSTNENIVHFEHIYDDLEKKNGQMIEVNWSLNNDEIHSYVERLVRPFNLLRQVENTYIIDILQVENSKFGNDPVGEKNLVMDEAAQQRIKYFNNNLYNVSLLPKSRFIMDPDTKDTPVELQRYNYLINKIRDEIKFVIIKALDYEIVTNEKYKDLEINKSDLKFVEI